LHTRVRLASELLLIAVFHVIVQDSTWIFGNDFKSIFEWTHQQMERSVWPERKGIFY
jgi:hypothetical protein